MVAVAQLVRASGCGPEGRRFEPGQSPQFISFAPNSRCLELFFAMKKEKILNP